MTAKERKQLKARGQRLAVGLHVGKRGLHPNMLQELNLLFQKDPLVKVHIEGQDAEDRKRAAEALIHASGAIQIALTGKSLLLFKPPLTV